MSATDSLSIPDRFASVMDGIAQGSARLSEAIRRGDLATAGEAARDLAGRIMDDGLSQSDLRWSLDPSAGARQVRADGALALTLDPLQGADDLDTNVPAGTIFGIWAAADTPDATFLRPARALLAAGYVIHGARCQMAVTFGAGTHVRTLRDGAFVPDPAPVALPAASPEFAIDAAAYRHWPRPIRAYIDDCLAGSDGPRAHNFSMHWTGSLVAEAHRILMRGGIALCPGDARPGQGQGRLSLLHHAAPVALLMEQAGGRATDGALPVLDATVTDLREPMPLIFGSADKVDRVAAYHDLPEAEVSALFGHRGLFRA